MRKIDKIIIHCSASDRVTHDNVETIRNWHVFDRGFSDIGYHYIITKNGQVNAGRDIHVQGAHCKGQNSKSIGICLTGEKYFSEQQFSSLRIVIRELLDEFGLDPIDVYPHNHFNKGKSCPNFNIYEKVLSQL
jgi:N-acetylmuramoyl-L-alanine amidase